MADLEERVAQLEENLRFLQEVAINSINRTAGELRVMSELLLALLVDKRVTSAEDIEARLQEALDSIQLQMRSLDHGLLFQMLLDSMREKKGRAPGH